MKLNYMIITFVSLYLSPVYGVSFLDLVEKIKSHKSVQRLIHESEALTEKAYLKSSWGDPQFRIMAKNFPKESLSDDQTPMTGIEFSINQKIPLTSKYGKLFDAYLAESQSLKYMAYWQEELLIKELWEIIIQKKK